MRLPLVFLVLLLGLNLASSAQGEDGDANAPSAATTTPPPSADREAGLHFARGESAERAGDARAAIDEYRRATEVAPTSRHALRAERRLAWLEPRAEADADALGALLAYRIQRSRTARDLDTLEQRIRARPPSLVRREAMTTIAAERDALATAEGSAAHVEEAERAYERALAEPGLTATERAPLVASYATLLGREGRSGEALLLLDREGHAEGSLRSRLELERIDAWARPLSWAWLAALGLAALALAIRALRAHPARVLFDAAAWSVPLSTIAYIVAGPLLLGHAYSGEAAHLADALALFLTGPLAAAALVGRAGELSPVGPALTRALQGLAGLAPLAAGYLAVYGVGDGPLTH